MTKYFRRLARIMGALTKQFGVIKYFAAPFPYPREDWGVLTLYILEVKKCCVSVPSRGFGGANGITIFLGGCKK